MKVVLGLFSFIVWKDRNKSHAFMRYKCRQEEVTMVLLYSLFPKIASCHGIKLVPLKVFFYITRVNDV